MINLLPQEEKKKLKKEYFIRLLSTYFFLIGVLAFTASALLLPTRLLSQSKEQFLKEGLQKFEEENPGVSIDELQQVIKDINAKLKILDNAGSSNEVSQNVIGKFLDIQKDNIKVYKIFYTHVKDSSSTIQIFGNAKNRTALNNFRASLEESGLYKDVELPISNFVKPTDIDFNIKLEIN